MTGRAGRAGRIVLVGTPIGNLGDLSPRAAEALTAADVIYCEDTRQARKLLSAAGIAAPRLVALHQHNEAAGADRAVRAALDGDVVALTTDAGMPGISDPGERVVRAAHAAGVEVQVVPGPTAAITALVVSGLPADRFCFEGFLPRTGAARTAAIAGIEAEPRTTILYEAPHRVARTLADLAAACGPDRPLAIGRELTKLHEELWRGTLAEAVAHVAAHQPKGEWVIVLAGASVEPQPVPDDEQIVAALRERLDAGDGRRAAVAAAAARFHLPKRAVYQLSIGLDSRIPYPR